MSFILKIAFIAGTVLALPNPNDVLLERDIPQSLGVNQGMAYNGSLTFTIYPETNCQGNPSGIYTGSYGFYSAHHMQSYSLSRDLVGLENLEFYSGPGPYNAANNGHYTLQCQQLNSIAGLNATNANDRTTEMLSGCHTLKQLQCSGGFMRGNMEL
ncbi:hypothetical protein BDR22DRAFT_836440 [Usnea florida]